MTYRLMAPLAALILLAAPAVAQDKPPMRPTPINGTVEKLDGQKLAVKTADGKDVSLTVAAATQVTRTRMGSVADVKAGQFIGCTAVEGADGKLHAQEIHILPESMRGAGEGHSPMAAPKTTMTNGNIENMSGVTDGKVIKVSYKGGQSEINITPDLKVTVIEVVSRDTLKPGTKVNVFAMENPPGTWTAQFIGLAP